METFNFRLDRGDGTYSHASIPAKDEKNARSILALSLHEDHGVNLPDAHVIAGQFELFSEKN